MAIHEACHAVAAYRTRRHMVIDIATIEKGGDYGGIVSSIPPEDQFTQWRSEYEADIIVSLASLAGERMFFDGDNSAGVGGDLRGATAVAALMEGYWGMGDTVASHGVSKLAITGGSMGSAEDGTDRNFLQSDLGTAGRGQAPGAVGGDHPSCSRRTATRSWRSRTHWRRTRRSPATTWRPSSKDARGRSWTAGRTGPGVRGGDGAIPRGGARSAPRARPGRPVDARPRIGRGGLGRTGTATATCELSEGLPRRPDVEHD